MIQTIFAPCRRHSIGKLPILGTAKLSTLFLSELVEEYCVQGDGVKKKYVCGSPEVAAKRFLSYLRLYRKERPTSLQIENESGKRFDVVASWYFGVLKESSFSGPEGEFYRLISVKRQSIK